MELLDTTETEFWPLAPNFSPESVFVDRGGNIFIADTLNYRIREVVASAGNIQTVAGKGTHVIPCGTCGDGVLATSTTLEI